MPIELIEPKWTKLVKREELWALVAPYPDGLHIIRGEGELRLPPGDVLVDFKDETVSMRARDFRDHVGTEGWRKRHLERDHAPAHELIGPWLVYIREFSVEYAAKITPDGRAYDDLFMLKIDGKLDEDGDLKQPVVYRQADIDKFIAQGYVPAGEEA